MKSLPSISIVTIVYNANLPIFKKSLDSVKKQDYPRHLIEQIIVDGGSTNDTLLLAKSYGSKIIRRPDLENQSEMRKSIGMKEAKHDIILFFESDNILIGKNWLRLMVLPFMEDKDIFCTFSMHNNYLKNMSLLSKYCALIGASDPPVCYLGKADKMMLDQHVYDKGKILNDFPAYTKVKFTEDTLPTFGDNGHMVRRSVISKVNKDSKIFLHTDAFMDLLRLGFNTYGVVKNSIIHEIGSSVLKLYERRVLYKERFRDSYIRKRVYLIFDYHSPKDRWNLFKYIVFSLTFIQPMFRAIRGYMSIPEPAWFLHPYVCFVAVVMYSKSEIKYLMNKFISRVKRSDEYGQRTHI